MARRRAVLVSDITENLSAVGNTGFVFATTNVADLQAKLEYILANPEMARAKGEEARTRIEQNFNWAVIGREMAKLYAETDRKAWIAASALEAR